MRTLVANLPTGSGPETTSGSITAQPLRWKTRRALADSSARRIKDADSWLDRNWDRAVEVAKGNTKRLTGRDSL